MFRRDFLPHTKNIDDLTSRLVGAGLQNWYGFLIVWAVVKNGAKRKWIQFILL